MPVIELPVTHKNYQYLETFLQDLEQSGKSKKTLVNYRSDLSRFFAWLPVPIQRMTVEHLRDYFKTLADLSPATQARKQASIQSFLSWCIRHDILQANPMDKLDRVKVPENLPRPIEDSIITKLLSVIPKEALRDRLLFTLMAETGLRISEALNLYVEDLSLVKDDEKVIVRGKGGKTRTVMLYAAPETLKLLKRYLTQSRIKSGALFRGTESKGGSKQPMCYRSAHHLWQKYCKAAGIENASIHALRHSFATTLINEGVDVVVVKKLLGHANLQTTMRYAEISDQYVKQELMAKHRRK